MHTPIEADIYPNPASNNLSVNIKEDFQTAKLELYSMQGQLLIQKQISQKEFALDVSELSEGIYQLRINTDATSNTYSLSIVR